MGDGSREGVGVKLGQPVAASPIAKASARDMSGGSMRHAITAQDLHKGHPENAQIETQRLPPQVKWG